MDIIMNETGENSSRGIAFQNKYVNTCLYFLFFNRETMHILDP